MTQIGKDQQVRDLRRAARPGDPVILYNAWDAGSAKAVAEAGAKAIATGSPRSPPRTASTTARSVPLELALANAERVVAAVDLPVTIDFEGGYAVDPDAGGRNMTRLAATGAIGCNFEDQVVGGEGLHPIELQCRADRGDPRARSATTSSSTPAPTSSSRPRSMTRRWSTPRSSAAGPMPKPGPAASSCPGLADLRLLARICSASPLPVNFMAFPGAPPKAEWASAGVARISHGPFPHLRADGGAEGGGERSDRLWRRSRVAADRLQAGGFRSHAAVSEHVSASAASRRMARWRPWPRWAKRSHGKPIVAMADRGRRWRRPRVATGEPVGRRSSMRRRSRRPLHSG